MPGDEIRGYAWKPGPRVENTGPNPVKLDAGLGFRYTPGMLRNQHNANIFGMA